MTKLDAIKAFAELVTGERVVISRKRDAWATIVPNEYVRLTVPLISQMMESDESDKVFRADFISRCPLAQGFANVTLTVLHECGHFMTQEAVDTIEYSDQVEKVGADQIEYMKIPAEMLATCWAICWLNSPRHRKEAKEFEKNFFGRG